MSKKIKVAIIDEDNLRKEGVDDDMLKELTVHHINEDSLVIAIQNGRALIQHQDENIEVSFPG